MCVFLSVTPCALPQNRGIKTIQNAIVVVLKGSRPIATGIEKNRDPEIKGKTKKSKKKRKGKEKADPSYSPLNLLTFVHNLYAWYNQQETHRAPDRIVACNFKMQTCRLW